MVTARVLGTVTMSRKLDELAAGRYLIAERLDAQALQGVRDHRDTGVPRKSASAESLVVFDQLGASPGQLIAVSEGAEATMPFHPNRVPIDAYCAAILDTVEFQP